MIYTFARKLLKWLPDKAFLQLYYRKNMHKWVDFKNPKSFNEKIQWLKVNDHNPIYIQLCDKYEVRKFVEKLYGKEYLIPCYGVYNSFSEIDFDKLPSQFVIKCTHDSGSVVVCHDKSTQDFEYMRSKIEKGLKHNSYDYAREWQYKNIQPRIIVEKFMIQDDGFGEKLGIIDYKFFCFNGKPQFYYVSRGLENHETARISFFDLSGNPMPFVRSDYKPFEGSIKPRFLSQMIEMSQIAAKEIGSDFLRVDFYEIDNQIYFSEFTLHPCSGVMPIVPTEWDYKIGDMLQLHKRGEKYDTK